MFRFNREGNLGGRRALASAAAALISDDSSGGAPAAPKPGDEPAIADGVEPVAPAEGETDGEPNTDDASTGDGSSVKPNDPPEAADNIDDGADAGDVHSEAALAAGRAQMAERIETVFASDECAGRESAAASLLAADIAPDRVIAMLGKLPKGAAADAMLSRLAAEASAAPVVAPGAAESNTGPKADVWGNAHKRAGFTA